MANTIQDFGSKIGGAKKDLWRERNLTVDDLSDLNELERSKFVKKDLVWKKPDYQAMLEEGKDRRLIYFIKSVYDAIPTKPSSPRLEDQKRYVNFIETIRNELTFYCRDAEDIANAYEHCMVDPGFISQSSRYYVTPEPGYETLVNNKLLKALQRSWFGLGEDVQKKQFLYSEDEKILSNFSIIRYSGADQIETDLRGKSHIAIKLFGHTSYYYPGRDAISMDPKEWKDDTYFVTSKHEILAKNFETKEAAEKFALKLGKMLKEMDEVSKDNEDKNTDRKKPFSYALADEVERDGPVVRDNDITGQDYIDTYGFRGGEFGNWLNDKERQMALNQGFDAFYDLQKALNITPTDVSFNGKLAIAFGARGNAGAVAHYEPEREVINLTKMKGAGALGHEWAHALDDQLGKKLGFPSLLSKQPDYKFRSQAPAFAKLLEVMKHKKGTIENNVREDKIKEAYKQAKAWIDHYLPNDRLNETQIARKEELLSRVMSEAGNAFEMNTGYIGFGEKKNETLNALSALRKEALGGVIPAKDMKNIALWQNSIQSAMEMKMEDQIVQTDFYKESIKFDNIHSKTNNGYWQSNCEMLARAFACYLTDKLPYRSDYLNALSEQGPVPKSDERKVINECIEEVLEEARQLGIIHVADLSKETSLEDLISDANTSISNNSIKPNQHDIDR